MIRRRLVVSGCLMLSGLAFGQVNRDAKKLAAVLTGDDKKSAAENPQCKLYTPAELVKYVGTPVLAGRNAAMGAGCQWVTKDDSGDVIVAVIPADYHTSPTLAKGYRALTNIGTKGFVVPELGGWAAGAIAGDMAVRVSVAGPGASESTAIDLLTETLRRRAR